jgi:hypothetical protein
MLCAAGAAATMASAAEPGEISVTLSSGRTFVGAIDPQTDRELLWLRVTSGPITLRRPIEWNRVERAVRDGVELSAEQLQAGAEHWKSAAPSADSHPPQKQIPPPPAPGTAVQWPPDQKNPSPASAGPAPVAALDIDAALGHWTAGVETSGIAIRIQPIDARGQFAAVDGTLEVELTAEQFGGPTVGDDRGTHFPVVARWSQAVQAADFGPSGAEYNLPFQARHPEFDTKLQPHGLVHARLAVPGSGVFDASQGLVRIRPYSALRDRLQEETGDRFFTDERTDR